MGTSPGRPAGGRAPDICQGVGAAVCASRSQMTKYTTRRKGVTRGGAATRRVLLNRRPAWWSKTLGLSQARGASRGGDQDGFGARRGLAEGGTLRRPWLSRRLSESSRKNREAGGEGRALSTTLPDSPGWKLRETAPGEPSPESGIERSLGALRAGRQHSSRSPETRLVCWRPVPASPPRTWPAPPRFRVGARPPLQVGARTRGAQVAGPTDREPRPGASASRLHGLWAEGSSRASRAAGPGEGVSGRAPGTARAQAQGVPGGGPAARRHM